MSFLRQWIKTCKIDNLSTLFYTVQPSESYELSRKDYIHEILIKKIYHASFKFKLLQPLNRLYYYTITPKNKNSIAITSISLHFSNVRSINKILHKILKSLEEKFLRSTKKYNNIVSVTDSNETEEVADKPCVLD